MMINKKHSYGFSLVELMVAMVIGLIVMGGAFSMHSTARTTQQISEVQMDMVADARFAIDMIAYDLRHAGAWGGTNKETLIECKSTDTDCAVTLTATGDCAPDGSPEWAYDLSLPVFATDNANPYSSTCIDGGDYVADTDVLEIRYADANTSTLAEGQAYVRSNFINGRVFVGDTAPMLDAYDTSPLTKNHVLNAYAYYVSDFTEPDDDIPSLRRVALVNGPAVQNQVLVSGVENLQVQFGLDSINDDRIIDRYVDASAMTTADWDKVYAAKIWLLLRSDEKQKADVDTKKSFSIAGVAAADYGGLGDYRYFMVSSVVNLRNLKQQ